jgi:esterase/lipase superfamily enzyme
VTAVKKAAIVLIGVALLASACQKAEMSTDTVAMDTTATETSGTMTTDTMAMDPATTDTSATRATAASPTAEGYRRDTRKSKGRKSAKKRSDHEYRMPSPAPPMTDIEPGKDYATVQVYYATNRAFTGETEPASRVYGPKRGRLSRGIAHVSIPRLHQLGRIEAPSVLRLEFREDPKKHIVLLRVLPQRQQDFYAKLQKSVALSKKREAFVFIHGFANTFDSAVKRTAQIKYDLAYDGAAILFSWPSVGKLETFSYTADHAAAESSTYHLRDFLVELAQYSGAKSISVVAHSMGNQILARAFQQLPESQQPRFDHVVLTAPDIDVDVFKQLAVAIRKPAGHVTLYVSKNDEALKVSKKVHGGVSRAGDSSDSVLVLDGFETVDVSRVDTSFVGHSYIADNSTVLSDVYCLIRGAAQAARRCRLTPKGAYWEFVGQLENVTSLENYTCTPPGCPFTARP